MTEEVDRLVVRPSATRRADDVLGRIVEAMGDDDAIRDEVRSSSWPGRRPPRTCWVPLLLLADHPGIQDRLLAAFERCRTRIPSSTPW